MTRWLFVVAGTGILLACGEGCSGDDAPSDLAMVGDAAADASDSSDAAPDDDATGGCDAVAEFGPEALRIAYNDGGDLFLRLLVGEDLSCPVLLSTPPHADAVQRHVWSSDGSALVYEVPNAAYVVDMRDAVFDAPRALPDAVPVGYYSVLKWSPAGDRLLYQGGRAHPNGFDMFVISWDGTTLGSPVRINAGMPPNLIDAWWSPDGTAVLFYAFDMFGPDEDEFGSALFVFDTATGTARSVTDALAAPTEMSVGDTMWVPNSRRVLFAARAAGVSPPVEGLYLADLAADSEPILVSRNGDPNISATVAPNGELAAYSTANSDGERLFVVDLSNPSPGEPVEIAPPEPGSVTRDSIRWSPDSRYIAFGFRPSADTSTSHIALARIIDGSAETVVDLPAAAGSPYANPWSPDSGKFAYSSSQPRELYVVDTSTDVPGATERVSVDVPDFGGLSSFSGTPEAAWSPSSDRVAYTAVVTAESRRSVIVRDFDSPPTSHTVFEGGAGSSVLARDNPWSPDGGHLLFWAIEFIGGEGFVRLNLASALGGPLRPLGGLEELVQHTSFRRPPSID